MRPAGFDVSLYAATTYAHTLQIPCQTIIALEKKKYSWNSLDLDDKYDIMAA